MCPEEMNDTLPSYSPHTDCWECTRGCRHETGDPPLHTHARACFQAHMHAHTSAALSNLQVCCCNILISYVAPLLSASSPISVLTCFSPFDTHAFTHFLLRLLRRLLLLWEPQHSTGRPVSLKNWENPNMRPCGRASVTTSHMPLAGKWCVSTFVQFWFHIKNDSAAEKPQWKDGLASLYVGKYKQRFWILSISNEGICLRHISLESVLRVLSLTTGTFLTNCVP